MYYLGKLQVNLWLGKLQVILLVYQSWIYLCVR